MRGPGHFQLADILLVNLIQRGKTVPVGGVTPVFPVFLLLARGDGFHRHRFVSRDQRLRLKHPAEAHQHRYGEHGGKCKRRGFVYGLVAVCCAQERPDNGT
ncbi:hypothetical protein D3C81_1872620 [compost metagenome]